MTFSSWRYQATGYATDFTALGVEVEPFQCEKISPSNAIRYPEEQCFEDSQASPYLPSDNSESFGGMILTGEDIPTCPTVTLSTQTSHGMTMDRTRPLR